MSLAKKILSSAILVSSALSFASEPPNYRDAAKILNTSDDKTIIQFNNGYFTTRRGYSDLVLAAGIYAGTIRVSKKTRGKTIIYIADGFYSLCKNPEAMESAAKKADINIDMIVTNDEALELKNKVLEEYCGDE